ncbi:hypothetical protein [Saccharopolyspora pogona]|uniref:hypothetical protein n=1 Tax=Saccharopolyspora pogona TaxID=333966 RepID=UPI001688EF19|nr:hypothetical protein [Saccharopolyspora pogona]
MCELQLADSVVVINDAGNGSAGEVILAKGALEPEQAADVVADSLDGGEFLILPHPEVADYYALRAAEPQRCLACGNSSAN